MFFMYYVDFKNNFNNIDNCKLFEMVATLQKPHEATS